MAMRVISRLDIKGPNLVKGINLEGLRVLGNPEDFAKHYYRSGADEIVYLDIVATLYGRNSILDLLSRTAREVHIPITVGGGLRSVDDIRQALHAGADKVSLNTAAIRNPQLIQDAANTFGSSTIVISIEAKKVNGRYEAYTDNGRELTGKEVLSWAREAESRGAGEILLTSIDNEGTGSGFDVELTRMVSDAVRIPVIACGGAGNIGHFERAIRDGHADAVCAAAVFNYHTLAYLADSTKGPGAPARKSPPRGITPLSISDLKTMLMETGISVRPSGLMAGVAK